MTLKRVIDADKISANLLFLRKSASAVRPYLYQLLSRLFTKWPVQTGEL